MASSMKSSLPSPKRNHQGKSASETSSDIKHTYYSPSPFVPIKKYWKLTPFPFCCKTTIYYHWTMVDFSSLLSPKRNHQGKSASETSSHITYPYYSPSPFVCIKKYWKLMMLFISLQNIYILPSTMVDFSSLPSLKHNHQGKSASETSSHFTYT